MIQELGGFISVIASFFSARKQNIDNWLSSPPSTEAASFFSKTVLVLSKYRQFP